MHMCAWRRGAAWDFSTNQFHRPPPPALLPLLLPAAHSVRILLSPHPAPTQTSVRERFLKRRDCQKFNLPSCASTLASWCADPMRPWSCPACSRWRKQTNKQKNRQKDKQTKRQTDKQTDGWLDQWKNCTLYCYFQGSGPSFKVGGRSLVFPCIQVSQHMHPGQSKNIKDLLIFILLNGPSSF